MYRYIFIFGLAASLASCGGSAETAATDQATADSLAQPIQVTEVMGIAIIEPSDRIVNLAAEQSGYIREIKINIGDAIKKGQVLLVLDGDVEAAQLAQATSKVATQEDAVRAARENLRLLEVKLDKAKADLSRNETLLAGNALTRQQVDDSRAIVADLSQQMRAQEATIRQQQTRLGEIKADINYYQTLANKKQVRSPIDGTVLSLDARVGQYLDAKSTLGEFAPLGPVIALTEIDEMFADRIQVGQTASIRIQGRTEAIASGKVVLASPYLRKKSLFADKAGDLEDRRVREVRVQLDDPSKVLLGARVECVIQVGGPGER